MASFRVVEHLVPGAHLREYTTSTTQSQEDVLQIAVKQYIPLSNPRPQPGDVTIIATHANGFPKEIYEPFWTELLARAEKNGWRIRSIWIPEMAWAGASWEANAPLLGNDVSWWDTSRDIGNLINIKRDEMPRPIVAVGNSMGAAQLAQLALFHPSLFTTMIMIDPVIAARADDFDPKSEDTKWGIMSTFRRTDWPSREEARTLLGKSPFYRSWDPRCFDLYVQHGLRDCPNYEFPDLPAPAVSLATPSSQEVWTFLRTNYEANGVNGKPINKTTHPELDPDEPDQYPFYRPESSRLWTQLPELRPSCFYIFGERSLVNPKHLTAAKVAQTGIGRGGSGGVPAGRVKGLTLPKRGHLLALETPTQLAEVISEWIGAEMKRYRETQAYWQREWYDKPLYDRQHLDEKWKQLIKTPTKGKNPVKSRF